MPVFILVCLVLPVIARNKHFRRHIVDCVPLIDGPLRPFLEKLPCQPRTPTSGPRWDEADTQLFDLQEMTNRGLARNIDALPRRGVALLSASAFVAYLLFVALAAALGPPVLLTRSYTAGQCEDQVSTGFDPLICKGVDMRQPDAVWHLEVVFMHPFDHFFSLSSRIVHRSDAWGVLDAQSSRRSNVELDGRNLVRTEGNDQGEMDLDNISASGESRNAGSQVGPRNLSSVEGCEKRKGEEHLEWKSRMRSRRFLSRANSRRLDLFRNIQKIRVPKLLNNFAYMSCGSDDVQCYKLAYLASFDAFDVGGKNGSVVFTNTTRAPNGGSVKRLRHMASHPSNVRRVLLPTTGAGASPNTSVVVTLVQSPKGNLGPNESDSAALPWTSVPSSEYLGLTGSSECASDGMATSGNSLAMRRLASPNNSVREGELETVLEQQDRKMNSSFVERAYDSMKSHAPFALPEWQDIVLPGSPVVSPDHLTGHRAKRVMCRVGEDLCEPLQLLRYQTAASTHNSFNFSLAFTNSTEELFWMSDAYFDFIFKNGRFAIFECLARTVMVGISVSTLLIFIRQLTEWPLPCWTKEQLWILSLLVMVIGYNDPLFVLVFIDMNPVLTQLGVIFRVTFLCSMFVFWIVMLESIAVERRKQSGNQLKLFFAFNLWLVTIAYHLIVNYKVLTDPFFTPTDELLTLWPIHLWLAGTLATYIVWLACLCYQALQKMRRLQNRFRYFFVITLATVVASILAFSRGFEGTLPLSATRFVASQGLLNLYLILASILYMPSRGPDDYWSDSGESSRSGSLVRVHKPSGGGSRKSKSGGRYHRVGVLASSSEEGEFVCTDASSVSSGLYDDQSSLDELDDFNSSESDACQTTSEWHLASPSSLPIIAATYPSTAQLPQRSGSRRRHNRPTSAEGRPEVELRNHNATRIRKKTSGSAHSAETETTKSPRMSKN